jgi:3-polyprenyl-4-hydroxybenzoate decarboxylase
LMVIRVLFSAVTPTPKTLVERLAVGFMESGRFRIVRS